MNDLIRSFVNNKEVFEVVKNAVLDRFREEKVDPKILSDEQIGQITRARLDGLERVEAVFREMERYRVQPTPPEPLNPAR